MSDPIHIIGPKGSFVTDNPARMDRQWVITQLKNSYWAKNLDEVTIVRSIMNSKAFGLYAKDKSQIGFVRLVSDGHRFAWVTDMIIEESARGQGLGQFFLRAVLSSPAAPRQGRIMLNTDDAHSFYEKLGFTLVGGKTMELIRK